METGKIKLLQQMIEDGVDLNTECEIEIYHMEELIRKIYMVNFRK